MSRTPSSRSKYLPYLAVGVLIGAARGIEATTSGWAWRARLYDSQLALVIAALVACGGCCLVTHYARRLYSPVITILLSVLVGATSTLVVSSIPGMFIGFTLGVVLTFDVTRRLALIGLRMVLWYGLAACLLGFLTGYLGSQSLLLTSNRPPSHRLALLMLLLGVAGIAWSALIIRLRGVKPWPTLPAAVLTFWLLAGLLEPVGVTFNKHLRSEAIQPSSFLWDTRTVGWSPEVFLHGWTTYHDLIINTGLSPDQANHLRGFKKLSRVWTSRGERRPTLDCSGLHRLDLSNVTELFAHHSPLNDEALRAFSNSPAMFAMRLVGTNVTDRGLEVLAGMPNLAELSLGGTSFNGEGLANLHPKASLLTLLLQNTEVNDATLRHVRHCALVRLDLRNTKVEGWFLKELDLSSLQWLDVSNSLFHEDHLVHLPNKGLQILSLTGTHLTAAGMRSIAATKTLRELRIHRSGVTDAALQPLSNLRLAHLHVDARLLTPAIAPLLAPIARVDLTYDGGQMELKAIIAHYQRLEKEILRLKREQYVARPAKGEPVMLIIHDLVVDADAYSQLKDLNACSLVDARIGGPDGELHGELDAEDLRRHFPDSYESREE